MRLVCALASGLIVILALAAACGDASTEPSGTYTETLHFTRAGHDVTLNTEVADEPGERAQGLMNRQSLPDDAGMLFVWPADTESGFWMRDTAIPLSIAFVTAGGCPSASARSWEREASRSRSGHHLYARYGQRSPSASHSTSCHPARVKRLD